MFATTGYIQKNVVLPADNSLERFNGRKVIITVLDDETPFETELLSTDELLKISDGLIEKNIEAYKELAK